MSTSGRAALWCTEGNAGIKLAYFSYISLPWQHAGGTTMKMRTLLLLKCASPFLVCVWVCVCISSQRSVFMLCLLKLYAICIFVCPHLFQTWFCHLFLIFSSYFPSRWRCFLRYLLLLLFWHELSHVPSGLTVCFPFLLLKAFITVNELEISIHVSDKKLLKQKIK